MRKKDLFILVILLLLMVITACGSSDVTTGEPTPTPVPTVVDYSDNKDLTKSQADEILLAWETDNKDYSLRGNIVYYGTFNGYLVLQAPITDGGITEGEYGYRRFESDGPVEIFLYGENADKTKVFYTLSQAISLGLIEDLDPIHRQHFVYCEQALGYSYSFDMMTPPEEYKNSIERFFSKYAYMDLTWDFTSGLSYYGEYNGYHIVFIENSDVFFDNSSAPETFGSFVFEDSTNYMMKALCYRDAETEWSYESFNASFYNQGKVSDADIQAIYGIFQKYELDYFRRHVEPDLVSIELPKMVDFSLDKSLTEETATLLKTEWAKFVAQDDVAYELRGDLVYYGKFDKYLVIQAPITEGGIGDYVAYRNFESDGPVEVFLYGEFPGGKTGFVRYMQFMLLYEVGVGDISTQINLRHFEFCQEFLGKDYFKEMLMPDDEIKSGIETALRTEDYDEVPETWEFEKGITYYGQHNGYHIFFTPFFRWGGFPEGTEIAGYKFPAYQHLYGYRDGKLYSMLTLYDQGELSDEDIESIHHLYLDYSLDDYLSSWIEKYR